MPPEMPSDDFLRLVDEQVSSAELIATLRERLAARQEELEVAIDLPEYGATGVPPEPPRDRPYNFSLYHPAGSGRLFFA